MDICGVYDLCEVKLSAPQVRCWSSAQHQHWLEFTVSWQAVCSLCGAAQKVARRWLLILLVAEDHGCVNDWLKTMLSYW